MKVLKMPAKTAKNSCMYRIETEGMTADPEGIKIALIIVSSNG